MRNRFSRRDLLRATSAVALGSLVPSGLWAGNPAQIVRNDRRIILIELEGGNDGLNTIIPLDAPNLARYNQYRPTLKLTPSTNLTTADYQNNYFNLGTTFRSGAGAVNLTNQAQTSNFGIHAALAKLNDAWRVGDMAIALGVGYANPNRSHFRGIDIWNGGATDDQAFLASGWLGRMFSEEGLDQSAKTNAVLLRRAHYSPLANTPSKSVAMNSPEEFVKSSSFLVGENLTDSNPYNDVPALVTAPPTMTGNPALDKILNARWQVAEARTSIANALTPTNDGQPFHSLLTPFDAVNPDLDLVAQARHVFRCVAGGLNCPVYKISLGGFDNHTNQKTKHADLLGELGLAISLLRTALIATGKWDSTLIMTYSEFGRRIEENGSAGTDHGTAAPHLILGGAVNGGIYGTQPTLAVANPSDDLVATMDFRNLYAMCGNWLGVASANDGLGVDPFNAGLSYNGLAGVLA